MFNFDTTVLHIFSFSQYFIFSNKKKQNSFLPSSNSKVAKSRLGNSWEIWGQILVEVEFREGKGLLGM